MCPVKLSLDCELHQHENPACPIDPVKYSITGLGSPWRALFSVEPVLQGLGFFHYTAWRLKVGRTGLAGLHTREGWAGKSRLECGHAGLRVESIHLRTEKRVHL